MSDTPEIKVNPAKAKADAELKVTVDKYSVLKGKTFSKKDGSDGSIVFVDGYAGIHTIHGGIRAHLLSVEIKGIRAWTPVASKFLEDYTEVKTVEDKTTETSKII